MKDSDRDEGNALRWRSTGNDKSELVINEYMDRQLDAGKRRRRILRLICLIVGGVMLVGVIAAGALLLFKVKTITVSGNTIYTAERIIGCCGVEPGENLLGVREEEIAHRLGGELPFIYSVRVERHLPDELNLVIFEETPRFYFQYESDFIVLSSEMKVLDIIGSSELFYETYTQVLRIEMPPVSYAVAGQLLRFRDEANKTALLKVLDALDQCSLREKISRIDFCNRFDVKLYYDAERFELLLGNCSDAGIKLEFARQIVASFTEDTKGTICVDNISGGYAIVDDQKKLIS